MKQNDHIIPFASVGSIQYALTLFTSVICQRRAAEGELW